MSSLIQWYEQAVIVNRIGEYLTLPSAGRLALCNKKLSTLVKEFLFIHWMNKFEKAYPPSCCEHLYTWLRMKESGKINRITYFALELHFKYAPLDIHIDNTPPGVILYSLHGKKNITEFFICMKGLFNKFCEEERQFLYRTHSAEALELLCQNYNGWEKIYKEIIPIVIDFIDRGFFENILKHQSRSHVLKLLFSFRDNDLTDLLIKKLFHEGEPKINSEEVLNLTQFAKKPEYLEAMIKSLVFSSNSEKNIFVEEDISHIKVFLESDFAPIPLDPFIHCIKFCKTGEVLLDFIKTLYAKNPKFIENTFPIIHNILTHAKYDISLTINFLHSCGVSFCTHNMYVPWISIAAKKYLQFPQVVAAFMSAGDRLWEEDGTFPHVNPSHVLYYICCLGLMKDLKKMPVKKMLEIFGSDELISSKDTALQFVNAAMKYRHFDVARYLLKDIINQIGFENYLYYEGEALVTALSIEDPKIREEMAFLVFKVNFSIIRSEKSLNAIAKLVRTDFSLLEKIYSRYGSIVFFMMEKNERAAINFAEFLREGRLDLFLRFNKFIGEEVFKRHNPLFYCVGAENAEQMIEQLLKKFPHWINYMFNRRYLLFSYDSNVTEKYRPIFKLNREMRQFLYDMLLKKVNIDCNEHDDLTQIYSIPPFLRREHWEEIKYRLKRFNLDFSDRNLQMPLHELCGSLEREYSAEDIDYITSHFSECLWVICDMISFVWERNGDLNLSDRTLIIGGNAPLNLLCFCKSHRHSIICDLIIGIIKHFSKIGYPMNYITLDGTALNAAYRMNNPRIIKALLDAGAGKAMNAEDQERDIQISKRNSDLRIALGRLYKVWV